MDHPVMRYVLRNQIILALTIIGVGWFLFQIREILILLFISYIVIAALHPIVESLRKYKIPKIMAIIFVYLVILSLIIILIVPLVPFFILQVSSLFARFPLYLEQAAKFLRIETNSDQINNLLGNQIGTIGANAFTVTSIVFGGLFSSIFVIVLSFYMLLDHDRIKSSIANFLSEDNNKKALSIISQIDDKLGAWARGQVILSLTIGFFTWVALSLLGFSSVALPLAIMAGMLEIIPTLGPILSAIPAVIVALAVSPTTTIAVIFAYVGIQFLENHILVPKIMQKVVGLNPILVIIGITIGGNLMGIVGALLSIPFISMLIIIYQNMKGTVKKN